MADIPASKIPATSKIGPHSVEENNNVIVSSTSSSSTSLSEEEISDKLPTAVTNVKISSDAVDSKAYISLSNDVPDIRIFNNKSSKIHATNENTIVESKASTAKKISTIDADSPYYDMNHEKRGIAIILNHEYFKSMSQRRGTNKDRDRIQKILLKFGFELKVYNDITKKEVIQLLIEVSEMDHSKHDCLVVVVLSHGEKGIIYAKDSHYPVDSLWEHFLGNECPTLLGKPKLFFIQACRGDALDAGSAVGKRIAHGDQVDAKVDKKPLVFLIPTMADLLTMYSTSEGYYAWRNPDDGSWFIQAFCTELEEKGDQDDLLTLLTSVSRRVAYEYKSNVPGDRNMHQMKQMPCIVSMLTKILYFTKKQNKT